MNNLLKDFAAMCLEIGSMPDYVQGGGGNTSVKLDDHRMAIKASGFQIKQLTETNGHVAVDYKKIAEYHKTVDTSRDVDLEKEAAAKVKECTMHEEGKPALRPSVEAGFHSILKTFVTHTHPVYANLLTCSEGGKELAKKIMGDRVFIWLPYINPGFELTLAMHKEIERCIAETGKFPQVIFLQNHGLVTTSDDAAECNRIHMEVNEAIAKYFGITEGYAEPALKKEAEGYSIPLPGYFRNHTTAVFDELTLYPDQLVYLNSNEKEGKIQIKDDSLYLPTSENEAKTIVETLTAYLFVIEGIEKAGRKVQTMGQAGIDFINNWESEKYRKSLSK